MAKVVIEVSAEDLGRPEIREALTNYLTGGNWWVVNEMLNSELHRYDAYLSLDVVARFRLIEP